MVDLIVCLIVLTVQVTVGVSVLRFLLSKIEVDGISNFGRLGRFKGIQDLRLLKTLSITLVIVYILLVVFRNFIYSNLLTDDLLHESIYLNGLFLVGLVLENLLKTNWSSMVKTILKFVRLGIYVYIVGGYGFYYLIFIFKLGFSGVLI